MYYRFTVEEIFEELAGYKDSNVRIEAAKPERIIQQLIITDRIPELISLMVEWCESENVNNNLIRFAAHFVIFLRSIGLQYDKKKTELILQYYVKVRKIKYSDHFYKTYKP